jgi:hypothetical protein
MRKLSSDPIAEWNGGVFKSPERRKAQRGVPPSDVVLSDQLGASREPKFLHDLAHIL